MTPAQPTFTMRDATIKVLTIIGFLATIALVVWLITLGFKNIPGNFASLASLAESLQARRSASTLTMTTAETVVKSGSAFEISWNTVGTSGEFLFDYPCADGVTVFVRATDGAFTQQSCDAQLLLPASTKNIFLKIESTKMRFTDVPFSLTYTDTAKKVNVATELKITVVNSDVPVPTTEQTPVPVIPKPAEPPKKTEVPAPTTPPTKPSTTPARTTPAVTSPYPVSDPNGFTDLEVKVLSVGTQQNGVYTAQEQFVHGTRGAIRFDVKNVGTKRSGSWTFTVSLPNEQGYTSVAQMPLGPQEHIESTLGFDLGDTKTPATVVVTIFPTSDSNTANNTVTKSVTVR